jgi:hypothetical protein
MGGAPLFAVWGAGSFIGGLLVARLGGGARTATGLALLLGALTAGHLALIPAEGSVLVLGAVLLVAGAAIAPTEATLYAMVDNAAPDGTITEAFAWLATAMAVGGAVGAAGAGIVADRAGPAAAFALAGGAGALALLTSMLRSRTIGASTSGAPKPAAPIATGSSAAGKAHTGRRGDCPRSEQVLIGVTIACLILARRRILAHPFAPGNGSLPDRGDSGARGQRNRPGDQARRIDALAVTAVILLVLSAGVSVIAGSPRFLLAKDALLTAVWGI